MNQPPSVKTIQRPSSSTSVRKKADEELFEFLNSGPAAVGSNDKKPPKFTSTPVKQRQSQTAKSVVPSKPIISSAEMPLSVEAGVF